jgi:D-threo-aldose 1-dehydrogenase
MTAGAPGRGLAIPTLGAGGGSALCAVPEAEAAAILDHAYRSGIRYFDTAPFYGRGLSEHRLGAFLRSKPAGDYILSTKVGRLLRRDPAAAGPGRLGFEVAYDYSRDGIMRSVEDSWQRLGFDHIDIAYIHDCSPQWRGTRYEADFRTAVESGYRALDDLRAQGLVGAIGVGVKDWDVCLRFLRAVDIDVVMLAGGYTLLEHAALATLLPECAARGVAVVLASPFNSGILAVGSSAAATYFYGAPPEAVLARVRALEAVAARHGVPLGAAAIQFPLHHPAVKGVVAGFTRTAEVDTNRAWLARDIPDALWEEMKAQGLIPSDAPTKRGTS